MVSRVESVIVFALYKFLQRYFHSFHCFFLLCFTVMLCVVQQCSSAMTSFRCPTFSLSKYTCVLPASIPEMILFTFSSHTFQTPTKKGNKTKKKRKKEKKKETIVEKNKVLKSFALYKKINNYRSTRCVLVCQCKY
ncbi:Schizosaccharomyces pombe specific protein Mug116 [Schizosaccharomyces pombe]|uniref:Meiotically up-regulated gene 116 protein n=1 Tax=Schizosaccharomyces pombe (strain 972 / ATCC 24843) TaxID=284812 RepID=MU116_SCHPO|nr:protein mug116 [Schizosaccharomyces pombe]O14202.1 RecName: Full=Meiotically up-regulated gene 116 protein [Schizosaccharomyces pombe 972h-]CAB10858.1 sequence orphan [Schizosaccharomyces pombe]|eukprot:NP_593359.1 protein mug116 [Schizosaccharomyces pombe]